MTYITKWGEIPSEYLVSKEGTEFVKFGGLLWLAQQQGVYKCKTRDISTSPDEIVFECEGYLIPNRKYLEEMNIDPDSPLMSMFSIPVITHGTTNASNTSSLMGKFRYVLAETRAIVRNLRIVTGCSLCGEDELDTFNAVEAVKTLKKNGVTISSAKSLLDNAKKTEPANRAEFITSINSLVSDSKAVAEYCKKFLNDHDANLLVNLSEDLLRELYNNCVQLLME